MSFRPVDYETWPRRPYFEHYFHNLPCTYSLTTELDITALLPRLRAQGLRFYPAMIWGISRAVNADPAFRTELAADGTVGIHDQVDPSYTIFHQDSETFSCLWTAYTPDLQAFCRSWEADQAAYGRIPGPVARPAEPGQGLFNISAVPWTEFTGFNLNLQKGYDYLLPIFTMGRYRDCGGRILLPLAIQAHHAVADGFHVGRLLERLRAWTEETAEL